MGIVTNLLITVSGFFADNFYDLVGLEEPGYDVLMESNMGSAYEVRRYGSRVAIETVNDNRAFNRLAEYIGVGGTPQNNGSMAINMTAPVTIDMTAPVTIDMTAPVVIDMTAPVVIDMTAPVVIDMTEPVVTTPESIDMTAPVVTSENGFMQFILPAEYEFVSQAPVPLSDEVWLVQLEPEVGAGHRYTWYASESRNEEKMESLMEELKEDIGDSFNATLADTRYMFYDPPFTPPFLRRNEVFVKLTEDEADDLVAKFADRKMLRH